MPPVQLCPQESGTWASTCTVSTISQSTQDSAPPVTTDLLPAPVLSLPGFNPETVKSHSTSIVPPRTSSVPLPGSNGGVSVPGSVRITSFLQNLKIYG